MTVAYEPEREREVLGSAVVDESVRAAVLGKLSADDFFDPKMRCTFRTMEELDHSGRIDEHELARRLDHMREFEGDGKAFVIDLIEAVGVPERALKSIIRLKEDSKRRQVQKLAVGLGEVAGNGMSLDQLTIYADELQSLTAPTTPMVAPVDVHAFIDADESETNWVIEGVMEAGDRLILTGREGDGKSFLLQQIAVQCAAGVHPFADDEVQRPLRVLLLDCENPPQELRRRLRALRIVAGDRLEHDRLFVESHPGGFDLGNSDEDRGYVRALVEQVQPNLVVVGPLYKLFDGDPDKETDAKPVAKYLDRLRVDFGVALIVEAHMPHATNGGRGRPIGWSGWRRWPDIGLELTAERLLREWRPARHQTPSLPKALKRGGEWPFTVLTHDRDRVWLQILEYARECPRRPTVREVADVIGKSKSLVSELTKEHRDEWEAIPR